MFKKIIVTIMAFSCFLINAELLTPEQCTALLQEIKMSPAPRIISDLQYEYVHGGCMPPLKY